MILKERYGYNDRDIQYLRAQVTFHRGRVLLEQGTDLEGAVSALTEAHRAYAALGQRDPRVFYYLGQAIRTQVERNLLQRARDLFVQYMDAGAPIGHQDEVRAFLTAPTAVATPAATPAPSTSEKG